MEGDRRAAKHWSQGEQRGRCRECQGEKGAGREGFAPVSRLEPWKSPAQSHAQRHS